ncbi:ATP-binding protein [Gellertiella hungarica]|nr:ATP-binding protein [Gellertiella hungarica]
MPSSVPVEDIDYVFSTLRVEHIFMKKAHRRFDMLRHTRRQILNGTSLRDEAKCATLIADTQSGKSTIVKAYLERNVVDYCYSSGLFDRDTPASVVSRQQRIVVYVRVSGASTLMSLLEDILRAYKDPRPEYGNLGSKKHRVLNYIQQFRTELLIFDEMNHLRVGAPSINARVEAGRVHNTLKDFLLDGCPAVFVGTTQASEKILSEPQIRARCIEELFLGPLSFRKPEHHTAFKEYCGLFGLMLQRCGLFPERSNFIGDRTLACIYIACGGYLGHAANLFQRAAVYAIEDGSPRIEVRHLSDAADDYTLFNKLAASNPFLELDDGTDDRMAANG